MALLNAEYRKASEEVGKNGDAIEKLTLKRDKLTQQMVLEANRVGLLKKELEDLSNEEGTNEKAIDRKTIALKNAETQLLKTKANMKELNEELEQQSVTLGKTTTEWNKIATTTGDVGKSLTKNVTAPIMAVSALGVKAAVDFDTAFVGVTKTVDGTAEQLDALKESIRGMATEIPASAVEIANVAEVAGQLGIEIQNIEDFTRVMIDLGNATNISATEGAAQLAQFANIMKTSQTDFDRVGSAIVQLGNNSATTEADILKMATRLAGAGAQVGMTEAQLLAFATALSSVGLEAEAGGTAMSKVMVEMAVAVETGGGALEDFANIAGMSTSRFKKAFKEDAADAVMAFVSGLGAVSERGGSAIQILDEMGITEVRLRDTLLRAGNASELFADSLAMSNEAWDANTALTKEADTRYASAASTFLVFKNNVEEFGMLIGESILPVLTVFVRFATDIVKAFNAIPEPLRNIAVAVALVVAAVGPLLLIVSTIANSITGVGNAMKMVNDIGTLFSSAAGNSVYLTFVKWAAIIIAVVAAVTALVVAINYLIGRGSEMNGAISDISGAMSNTQRELNSQAQNTGRRSYAIGTQYHPGGRAMVGEYGPEEVVLPKGAKVLTANETAERSSNNGTTYQINGPITIQTNDAEDLFNQIQILARRGALA